MPDRTYPNEHERSRPPTAHRGSPLWLSVREPLARVDSVHLCSTHFTAWKRTPSSALGASLRSRECSSARVLPTSAHGHIPRVRAHPQQPDSEGCT